MKTAHGKSPEPHVTSLNGLFYPTNSQITKAVQFTMIYNRRNAANAHVFRGWNYFDIFK